MSLARRVSTPPVWVEELSFNVFLQEDVIVFVWGGGLKYELVMSCDGVVIVVA